jgi:ribonucleoside-diphosphate reductase alpha chain
MPQIKIQPGSISDFVWREKYQYKAPDGTPIDLTPADTFQRVAGAIASCEQDRGLWATRFFDAMKDFEFIPAGRILAGAGTGRDVTLNNCYVLGTIEDSLDGIMRAVSEAAMTLKQGGGIGMNFSTLRPRGALVKGVDSVSSGAVSFMELWHSMCGTIMSAGSRRGAMMGTLRCDHPDIEEFITAKQTAGRLTNFNVSVLVTDGFMETMKNDGDWDLSFDGKVYKTVQARDLWNKIIEATYEYAEPGVIFIDRVNDLNPLADIEDIVATNPCGEQPLPPYGACVLGSINLATLVLDPFTTYAKFDTRRLRELAGIATRFLDNVVTTSKYPLEAQRIEADNKRRIGIGITGLADALIMLGIPYASTQAEAVTRSIVAGIEDAAMQASRALADEKGAYLLWTEGHGPKRRNSHLTSIAPTGTISCFAGNVSSGIEPVFEFEFNRNVLLPDGSKKKILCHDYAAQLFFETFAYQPSDNDVWATATKLTPTEHMKIAAAAQRHIDSAISKTINCPADMTFEDFGEVYTQAYKLGMKGCTTYRPSGVRGAVLEKIDDKPKELVRIDNVVHLAPLLERPEQLHGKTYKIKPNGTAIYVTINDVEVHGQMRPFEIFFSTKAVECQAWMVALSRMLSAVFRKGGDISFVPEELASVYDPQGGHWAHGKYVPSTAAAIGQLIKEHMTALGMLEGEEPVAKPSDVREAPISRAVVCPKCHSGALIRREGCWGCDSCHYSKC